MRRISSIISVCIFLCGALTLPVMGQGAGWDWKVIPKDKKELIDIYYDAANLKQMDDHIIRVWAKYSLVRDESFGNLPAAARRNYDHTKVLVEIDCYKEKIRQLAWGTYDSSDREIYLQDLESYSRLGLDWAESASEWKYAVLSGVTGYRLIKGVCQDEMMGKHIKAEIKKGKPDVITRKLFSTKRLVFTCRNTEAYKKGQIIFIYSGEKFVGSARVYSLYSDEIYTYPVDDQLYDSVEKGNIVSPLPPEKYRVMHQDTSKVSNGEVR